MSSGKRKRNDLTSQYNAGGYIPQQDGAGDAALGDFEIEVFLFLSWSASYISDVWSLFVSGAVMMFSLISYLYHFCFSCK